MRLCNCCLQFVWEGCISSLSVPDRTADRENPAYWSECMKFQPGACSAWAMSWVTFPLAISKLTSMIFPQQGFNHSSPGCANNPRSRPQAVNPSSVCSVEGTLQRGPAATALSPLRPAISPSQEVEFVFPAVPQWHRGKGLLHSLEAEVWPPTVRGVGGQLVPVRLGNTGVTGVGVDRLPIRGSSGNSPPERLKPRCFWKPLEGSLACPALVF